MTVQFASTPMAATSNITPTFAAGPITPLRFAGPDKAAETSEDTVDISNKDGDKKADKYTWGHFFGFSRNVEGKRTISTIFKDLFLDGSKVWTGITWGLTLPPFTLVIPVVTAAWFAMKRLGKDKPAIEVTTDANGKLPETNEVEGSLASDDVAASDAAQPADASDASNDTDSEPNDGEQPAS